MTHTVLLTPQQLSEVIHVPARTLERWRQTGYGPPYVRVGRRALYRREDVEAWIASQVRQHVAEEARHAR